MGLLSNPKQRQKIVDAISRYNNILCGLFYVVGVVWFLALAYQPFNAKTYFSENALLPGVVESGFYFDTDYREDLTALKEELKKDKRNVPRDWVYRRFSEIGLDTYIQNYTIRYPLHITRGQELPGQNVYGILRARRTASTEAIVLSVPFRAKSSDLPATHGGIILMLGLAKHFMKQPYWSKDIIFLVTDHEQIGMQAWLDGYHEVHANYIIPGMLAGRSGPIQAAINLEIPEGSIKYFNVKIEGLNGQLPNLDLINLVVRLCHKTGVDVMLHNSRDPPQWEVETLEGFQKSLSTMVKMMWAQASGLPSGNHGLFHRYHIEAITLEGIRKKKTGHINIEITGRIVEGICRSLNNLLERFHQSFFFYILPGTERYVSIGLYMIPFGIMCAAGLIKTIALWVSMSSPTTKPKKSDLNAEDTTTDPANTDNANTDDGNTKEASTKKLNKESLKDLVDEEVDEEDSFEDDPKGFLTIIPLLFSSVLMSILCYSGPEMLAGMAVPFKMNIEDGIFFGYLALFTASLLFPKMVARKTSDDKKLLFDWVLAKSISLIFQSLMLFAIALMNVSLAFFIALITIPISVVIHPSHSRLSRWGQKLLLLLISPLSIFFITALIETYYNEKLEGFLHLLVNSWNGVSRGLLLCMVDSYLFGSTMFVLFSFTILPNWLTLWGISFCEAT